MFYDAVLYVVSGGLEKCLTSNLENCNQHFHHCETSDLILLSLVSKFCLDLFDTLTDVVYKCRELNFKSIN